MSEKVPEPPSARIYRRPASDAELLTHARQCIAESKAALQLPRPSTFLGESCREPRPQEK
jgi:hypothetical protein